MKASILGLVTVVVVTAAAAGWYGLATPSKYSSPAADVPRALPDSQQTMGSALVRLEAANEYGDFHVIFNGIAKGTVSLDDPTASLHTDGHGNPTLLTLRDKSVLIATTPPMGTACPGGSVFMILVGEKTGVRPVRVNTTCKEVMRIEALDGTVAFQLYGGEVLEVDAWGRPITQEESPAKKPAREPRKGNYVAAGAVICTDQRAFARVIAIERSNNPYIPLPDNCEHVGANVPVNVLRTSSFLGESLTLVGNSGGTVWVQSHNVR